MTKYIFILLSIIILYGCTVTSPSNSREVTTYWGPAVTPSEIYIDISIYSGGTDWHALNNRNEGWWFPDFQGFPMALILQDQNYALMASPYIDQKTREDLIWNLWNSDPRDTENQRKISDPRELSQTGEINDLLWIGITNTYPKMISWDGGGLSISGIPNNKKISLSYPLVLPTEIEYYSGDLNYPIKDPNWSPYRSNRIMEKNGNTWSATGSTEEVNIYGDIPRKSIVRNWIQEGEVNNLDEIRIRIFPDGYNEDIVLPLVKINTSWANVEGFTKNIDIYAEKNGKIIRQIIDGQTVSGEGWSDEVTKDGNGEWIGRTLILKNISHKNLDTIILKKRVN